MSFQLSEHSLQRYLSKFIHLDFPPSVRSRGHISYDFTGRDMRLQGFLYSEAAPEQVLYDRGNRQTYAPFP
jgi:hypothetical protein